jgi:ribosomally synthesized peptide (two-chain TOMM family)
MPLNNELPNYETLLEFQEVYTLAVALSWKDEEFKKKFVADPKSALEHYFSYKCPWNIELQAEAVTEGGPHDYGWKPEKQKWHLPKSSITFGIPEVPLENDEICIALASYNDAGPTYLFSCC